MTLKLNGSSSGSVSIDAPASTTSGADITFKLPVADGTSSQILKTDASGNLGWSQPGAGLFLVKRGTNQSISNTTWTKIQFNSETYDVDNWFDSSTNYRYTPQVAGYYWIDLSVAINGLDDDELQWYCKVTKNGSNFLISTDCEKITSGGSSVQNIAGPIYLNGSSDYIEGEAYYSFAGPSVTIGTYTTMQGYLVRPA